MAAVLGYTANDYGASTGGAFSHTPAPGTNLILLALAIEFTATGQACTWDGGAATPINNVVDAAGDSIYAWLIRNPAPGVAKNVAMSWATSRDATGWAVDIGSAGPVVAGTTATGIGSAPSVDVVGATGGLIVDFVVTNNPAAPTAPAAGQTLIEINHRMGASWRISGANPQAMGWTLSGADNWAINGIHIPSFAGNQVIWL